MRKIGILGSGQLGRMTIEGARRLLCDIEVLSPDYPAPAAELADATILGGLQDAESIRELADRVSVLSYEIEHVNVAALREVERSGTPVLPASGILSIIQDKSAQKALLDHTSLPTAPWLYPESLDRKPPVCPEVATAAQVMAAVDALGGWPLVQKSCHGGYDGRGVAVLRQEADLLPQSAGGRLLGVPSFLEAGVDFKKELAVVVAVGRDGTKACYPCVEMLFDERVNMCDSVLMPANEPASVLAAAEGLAMAVVDALGQAARAEAMADGRPYAQGGVFAVELFLCKDGSLLVNETAPRPHNSGHLTIEACVSSQFDQYYRILAGYPLGSTEQLRPAMMVNLLAEPAAEGEAVYEGLAEAMAVPGVSLHLYGKRQVQPFRKMGHLTALGATASEAMERAAVARACIRITGR